MRYRSVIVAVVASLLCFVVLTVVDTVERLRWTLLTAVASMGLSSLYVFREWMKDPWWRPGSISGDANYFALNAALVLPVGLLLVFRSRVLWERMFALGCIVAIIVSTVLCASRGGLLHARSSPVRRLGRDAGAVAQARGVNRSFYRR